MPSCPEVDSILAEMKKDMKDLNEMLDKAPSLIRKPTILIIDDDLYQLKSATLLLSPKYEVLVASTGLSGIAMYDEHKKDIKAVLLDIRLPDKDGFEVYLSIKIKNQHIPIIFLTAHQNKYENSQVICAKYQPFGYIVKNHENEIDMIKSTIASAVNSYNQYLELERLKNR